MLPNANEGEKRIRKYLSENANPEATPNPKDKQEQPPVKKDVPVNDDFNEYDITDEDTVDDRDW